MLVFKEARETTARLSASAFAFLSALLLFSSVSEAAGPAPLATDGAASERPWARYGDWPKAQWNKFNTLATDASPKPPEPGAARKLDAPIVGDPAKGKTLAFDRRRGGSCLACHVMGPGTAELPGNVGPDLSQIGSVGHPDEYLFNVVYDPRVYIADTTMPPWGAHGLFNDAEIKDIVAFLKSLKTPAAFKDPIDDPAKRPLPKETRDNLDPFVNDAVAALERGKDLFAKAGKTGKACASCHRKPEAAFKTWAAKMPKYEPRMKKVLGVEEFVYRHALATTGEPYPMQSAGNTELAIYLRNLANGQPIDVDVTSPGAKEVYEKGKALSLKKIGQLNFACIDCHTPDKGANKWIRGQYLTESRGQIPHFPTWRTSRSEIWDIRKRLQWCGVAIRADDLPPDAPEYDALELYLGEINKGLKLSVPGIRH